VREYYRFDAEIYTTSKLMTVISLRRLWTLYKVTAIRHGLNMGDVSSAQLAFYSGAHGVLRVLADLIEQGNYQELHEVIRRHRRMLERIKSTHTRVRWH
jgi:hypothetical protein